ncbi:transcription elongation factor GreB [Raoultella planticola]|nr:transcription elongation factor GreB [Raoultella planticola]
MATVAKMLITSTTKKRLREIDRRVRYLTKCLENLKIVDYSPQQEGKVFFGAWVEIENDDGDTRRFRIVGYDEIFGRKDYISIDSPMARALLKKRGRRPGGCQHARRRSQLVRQQYRICEIARPEQSESLVSRLAFCRASPYNYPLIFDPQDEIDMMNDSLCRIIAGELQARSEQVEAAVRLLDEGNTVPFIARYRKEVTGGLDDTQLRNLETRLGYLRELEDRRQSILKSIGEQGKLTDALEKAITTTLSKTELEDLYLPYKPKRRTRGQIAIEAGLEPLADLLWNEPSHDPETEAAKFVDADKGVADTKAALDGARYILMERFAEDAALLAKVRDYLWKNAHLVATVVSGKEEEGAKFRDYFDHHEPIATVPSHRALAMFRGRNEGILQLALNADPQFDEPPKESHCEQIIIDHLGLRLNHAAADSWRKGVVSWTWRIKVLMHLETELMGTVRERAEDEAINVFARNLHDLLMAAPAGLRATMGLDPGLRTGVKVAVVDGTGKLVATDTIYPHTGQAAKAAVVVAALCEKTQR